MSKSSASTHAESWAEHEHVAAQVQMQAQRLLDEAGSPNLARHAVEAASASRSSPSVAAPDSAHDQFAGQVGFPSYLALFEASTPVASSVGKQWLVTALRNDQWIVWNDVDLAIAGTYPTRDAAERGLPSSDSRGES